MKRLLSIVLIVITSVTSIFAQQLKIVDTLHADLRETKAVSFPKKDLSGKPCGLILLGMVIPDAKFEGDIVGAPEYKDGEWWIYMTDGASWLTIKTDKYLPLKLEFFHKPIKSSVTYIMAIEKPDEVGPKKEVPTNQYLVIKTEIPDAKIYINNELIGYKEVSKYLPLNQEHHYKIESKMYHSKRGTVTLSANEKTVLNIELDPAFGYLNVTTEPEGAKVEVNGKMYTSPFKTTELPSGLYEITAFKDMYNQQTIQVEVEDGKTKPINIVLTPNFANVTIKVAPNDAFIFVDGKNKGKGQWTGQLSTGVHNVEVKKEGYRTYTQTISVEAGDKINVTLPTLEPMYGMLNIRTTPMDVVIEIDGKKYGTTPMLIQKLLVGNRTLKLYKDGWQTVERTLKIEEGKTTECSIELTKEEKKVNKPVAPTAKKQKVYYDYFLMANLAYSIAPQMSYGLTFGKLDGSVGWYTSVAFGGKSLGPIFASNIKYDPENYYCGNYTETARLSIMAGMLFELSDILALKVGAGYGLRNYACKRYNDVIDDEKWTKISENSYQGVDWSIGAHFAFGRIAMSLDVSTISFKYSEVKLGMGIRF